MANEEMNPIPGTTGAIVQPKVEWDDTQSTTHYANIGSVMGRREEMIMVFGNAESWKQGSESIGVKVTNRVVMNPFTLKRFSRILAQGVEQYENRFGEIKLD
jgi:hypothetical protein